MTQTKSYHDYEKLKSLGNDIVSYLFNNENIFKLLKYETPDALIKPNLTKEEKRNLVYKGEPDSSNFRIFMQPFTDDAFTEEHAQLRVFSSEINPSNRTIGIITVGFEVLSHVKIDTLSEPIVSTRCANLMQEVISTLNGVNFNGLGNLSFNKNEVRANFGKLITFSKNYIGYRFTMSNHVV